MFLIGIPYCCLWPLGDPKVWLSAVSFARWTLEALLLESYPMLVHVILNRLILFMSCFPWV